MIQIDWDAVRSRLPVYAYEYYDSIDENGRTLNFKVWLPYDHKGQTPPPGWKEIVYEDSDPDLWRAAADAWLKEVLRPNEKAVWFDTATGDFGNTFRLGELLASGIGDDVLSDKANTWRLIVYRCEGVNDFEFSNLMRIVTKPREARR